jgi:hypothetical protein
MKKSQVFERTKKKNQVLIKQTLILLVFLLGTSGALNAADIKFDNVSPSIADGTTEYQQQIDGATSYAIVSKSDGITSAVINASTGKITKIAGNGIIRVKATEGDASAEYVLTVAYATHSWNFHAKALTFGVNGGTAVGDAETDGEITNDYWEYINKMVKTNSDGSVTKRDPIYAYKNAVNGDNGLIIAETIGLQFNCLAGHFGVSNGNSDLKRHVSMGGSPAVLTIPKLKAGQYVKIYWSPYASGESGATFTASNVTDLNDVEVTNSFAVNGIETSWSTVPKGATIFKVKSDGDVSFTLTDPGWNDLIQIVVSNDFSSGLVLSYGKKQDIATSKNNTSIVHEKGKETTVNFTTNVGYIGCERGKTPSFIVNKGEGSVTYAMNSNSLTVNGTGTLKVTENILTGDYVFDKNITWLAVGEYTQQKYPYTWDFTKYNMDKGNYVKNISSATKSTTSYGTWKKENSSSYGLTIYSTVNSNVLKNTVDNKSLVLDKTLFAQGSQLCYGATALPETEGLRVSLDATSADANNIVEINGQRLRFAPDMAVTLTIPAVDNNMYVFVSASKKPSKVTINGTEVTAIKNSTYALESGVYLYQNTSGAAADVTISDDVDPKVIGMSLYKIGVTNINKNINADGKTTESRDRAIDYSQSGYFTQNSLQPYYIANASAYNATTDKITMKKISVTDANTGLVLYNTPETKDNVADDVPLFVPAINISTKAVPTDSPLKPNVTETSLAGSDADTYRYVYTNQFNYKGQSTYQAGDYGFYKVNSTGTLAANKAYLELPATSGATAAKNIVLLGFDDDSTTGIINTAYSVSEFSGNDVYYNMNGLRLNGKPSQKGIYIVNGKKVLFK